MNHSFQTLHRNTAVSGTFQTLPQPYHTHTQTHWHTITHRHTLLHTPKIYFWCGLSPFLLSLFVFDSVFVSLSLLCPVSLFPSISLCSPCVLSFLQCLFLFSLTVVQPTTPVVHFPFHHFLVCSSTREAGEHLAAPRFSPQRFSSCWNVLLFCPSLSPSYPHVYAELHSIFFC